MSNITNNFAEGSVTMLSGSSMNGDIHIDNVYNGQIGSQPNDNAEGGSIADEAQTMNGKTAGKKAAEASPLRLSVRRGTKIDFIRMMNAWYECGYVEDKNGARPTKREYFKWLGKLFNTDFSDYDKSLSNSMATGVGYEIQSRIFEELKKKHEDIYNSK